MTDVKKEGVVLFTEGVTEHVGEDTGNAPEEYFYSWRVSGQFLQNSLFLEEEK